MAQTLQMQTKSEKGVGVGEREGKIETLGTAEEKTKRQEQTGEVEGRAETEVYYALIHKGIMSREMDGV